MVVGAGATPDPFYFVVPSEETSGVSGFRVSGRNRPVLFGDSAVSATRKSIQRVQKEEVPEMLLRSRASAGIRSLAIGFLQEQARKPERQTDFVGAPIFSFFFFSHRFFILAPIIVTHASS